MSVEDAAKEVAWVYVWKLTPEKVGHTSIRVGETVAAEKSNNKTTTTANMVNVNDNKDGMNIRRFPSEGGFGRGSYLSIHPGFIPAIGPTTVLPLPPSLSRSLKEDMLIEGAMEEKDACDDNMNGSPSSSSVFASKREAHKQLPPDHTFRIEGLNTSAMRKEMNEIERSVDEGNISYQLLPRVRALGFLRELPGYIAQDPVDIGMMMGAAVESNRKNKVFNCATMVGHLLETGGMSPVSNTFFPWDPTPNGITEHLTKCGLQPPGIHVVEETKSK